MALNGLSTVLQQLRRMVRQPASDESDAQLLSDYAAGRTEAFEELVRRHSRMVYGVCRRILFNDHDAEDAFQATFLVLARRQQRRGLSRRLVQRWLYGVACRRRGMSAPPSLPATA